MTVPPGPGVRVGGDVLGQLVVGSYNVVVNATEGSSVTVRAGGPPSTQRRRVRSIETAPARSGATWPGPRTCSTDLVARPGSAGTGLR